jgi:4-hydroxyacetophenone monooxygenase
MTDVEHPVEPGVPMPGGSNDALSGATLEASLAAANIPTLLMVLVHATGDQKWFGERYHPKRPKGLTDQDAGGLPEDVQVEIRRAAADALTAQLQPGAVVPPVPDPDELVRMMTFAVGEPVPDKYGPMMAMDLSAQLFPSAPVVVDPPTGLDAIIIGAGPSGLAAAIKLGEAGIPYTLIDRNVDVAGTWRDNGYPGAAVDTPNHIYSFTFEPYDWSRFFAGRDELRDYLTHLADTYGIREHSRLGTEATSAAWDETSQTWRVTIVGRDGVEEELGARILISAVGALNRPQIPAIPGLDRFVGPSFHTARWPEGFDLRGKRVGVIGTGASAMQLVPAIVDETEKVTVFQRSPQWAAPFEKFKVEVPPGLRRLLFEVPLYRAWYRLRQGWIFNDKVYDSLIKDPEWNHPDRSINAVNEGHRQFFTRYILDEIGDRDDLLDKVVPTYPPFGKRMLLDNRWFRTMAREDVCLETGDIREVTADRVVMASGVEHPVDVLVLATGFDAVHFLASIDVTGRSGRTLAETWDGDDAKAYLGLAVPDFPNFFSLYGPNTQTGHGGSLMYLVECQLRYIMDLVAQMVEREISSVECRDDVYETYNHAVDEAHDKMIWTHHGMHTYYRNSRGRVVVNSPWRVVDFWRMTQSADLDEYVVEKAAVSGVTG